MITINSKITQDLANFIKMRYNIDVSAHSETYPEMFKAFLRLQYWMDQATLDKYFGENDDAETDGTYWTQQLEYDTRRTGQELADRLQQMSQGNDQFKALDVGCGDNHWKKILGGKLTGIDPYNSKSDFKIDIMNYNTNIGQHDVVLALGSINFGDEKTIQQQMVKVVKMCKAGGTIFWRFNPGITHDNQHARWVDFYPWTEEKIRELAGLLKCDVVDFGWDHIGDDTVRWGNRFYCEWRKQTFNS